MTIIIIILLVLAIIYLYYQNRKLQGNSDNFDFPQKKVIFDEDYEDLIADKDLAVRERNEAQAENLSLSNKLKLKHQEITRKEAEIERLKKEASEKELALNKKLTEKNGLITTLQREVNQHKQKHTEQLRAINMLFDPQAENYSSIDFKGLYALLEKIAQEKMPGSFPEEKKDD